MEKVLDKKPQVHSVFDSDSLKRQQEGVKKEEREANNLANYLAKMCEARMVLENQWNEFEHQQGQRLLAPVFEQKVKNLVPSIVFFTRPLTDSQAKFCNLPEGSQMKSMELLLPNGSSRPIAGYQNHPILPEYTILLQREVKVPNPYVQHADAKDFPKANKVNGEWKFEKETPFEVKTIEPAGTLVGWRTLLARLVLEHLSTPTEIEREFGSGDRKSWAARMGRIEDRDLV